MVGSRRLKKGKGQSFDQKVVPEVACAHAQRGLQRTVGSRSRFFTSLTPLRHNHEAQQQQAIDNWRVV